MKYNKSTYFFLVIFSVLMVSCVTNRNIEYLQEIKDLSYGKADSLDYRIKNNDEINILVYSLDMDVSQLFISGSQTTSQTYTYLVYNDGTIDIPYVHKIKIAGLTIQEATNEIEKRLKDYIPDVEIKIALANKFYYIIGDGNNKGSFPLYKDRLNIFEALAMGGDLNLDANRKKVKILREVKGEKKIMEFDIRSKSIIDSEYYYIQPNDIIYLTRSKKSFYKVTSFTGFLGMISSSLTFVLLVINYSN